MIRLATAHEAPDSSYIVRASALMLAVFLVVMAVGQLFTFDEMIELVGRFGIVSSHGAAVALVSVLAVCEVFALPFLLRMNLSQLMRVVSTACGWVVAVLWLWISVTATTNGFAHSNIGFFGEKLPVPIGWWTIAYSLVLVAIMAVVTWGFWFADHQRGLRHIK